MKAKKACPQINNKNVPCIIVYHSTVLCFILIITLWGCKNDINIREYAEYVSANKNWVKIWEDEKFRIRCNYFPADFMAISELRTYLERNDSVPKVLYDKTRESFSGAYYFRLTVSNKDSSNVLLSRINNQTQYSAITNELTYNMNKYVYMVTIVVHGKATANIRIFVF